MSAWPGLLTRFALPQKTNFSLALFLPVSLSTIPLQIPHSSLAPSRPAYEPGTSPVSLLIGCKSWFIVVGGGGGEDFYNFCVSFCLVFHFVWLSISKFSCLCYCLPPITPSETYWKYPMSIRFKFLTANKFYDFNMVKWFIYPDFSNLINSL